MTLPTYVDLFEWMHSRGMEPLPCPGTRPTRKGLGRYLMACSYERGPFGGDALPEWRHVYLSCEWAYNVMLQVFHLRLPRDTFRIERARVEAMIEMEKTLYGSRREETLWWARRAKG